MRVDNFSRENGTASEKVAPHRKSDAVPFVAMQCQVNTLINKDNSDIAAIEADRGVALHGTAWTATDVVRKLKIGLRTLRRDVRDGSLKPTIITSTKGTAKHVFLPEDLSAAYPEKKDIIKRQNQLTINIQEAANCINNDAPELIQPDIVTAPRHDRETARVWHLQEIGRLRQEGGLGIKATIRRYEGRLLDGRVELPDWVAAFYRTVSFDNLYLWYRKFNSEGISGLAWNNKGYHNGHFVRHPEQARFVEGLLLSVPQATAKQLWSGLKAEFKQDLPSKTTVGRWLNSYMRVFC